MPPDASADFVTRFDLKGPLIQAPMAGGASTAELVAAVCNAGALGSLGGAYLSPGQLKNTIGRIKRLTDRPFTVNLFAPAAEPALTRTQIDAALSVTRTYRQELGIADPAIEPPYAENFREQFAVVLEERPAVFSFTFGVIERGLLDECRRRGIFTLGTATTPQEALALQDHGADGVVGQGAEAGAHRGTFTAGGEDALMGLAALIPALRATLRIPVISAGGI